MSNRVYTYRKITELKKAPWFARIAALPQLTMSREMAVNMAYDMRVFKGNIMGFSSFSMRLFPGWNSSGQKFACMTALSGFMRGKLLEAADREQSDWLLGCKKNLYFAVANIIHLEEAQVRPEDLGESDRDSRLFQEMWRYLEQTDEGIANFRKRLEELKNPENFSQEVNRIFRFHGGRAMVWNGFPFLTPLQQFVYDCFVRAGYEIYALLQDDKRYPYANEIWNHFYTTENGYPRRQDWICQEDGGEKNPLGEIFEGAEQVKAPNLKIIKYSNTVDFIADIPRLKTEGFYLYCTDDRAANRMLKDYFPEHYEGRNLLAYPVGQFLYALHRMWDETLQCAALSPENLRTCFLSGWICADGKSSVNYTDDLERILPYFEGCYRVEEWRDRLSQFLKALDLLPGSGAEEERGEIQAHPLEYFGVFSVTKKRGEETANIIRKLLSMAESLFDSREPVSIKKHMGRLDGMLYQSGDMPRELYLEEKEKMKQIFAVLESHGTGDFLCWPGDMAAALLAFMSGQLEEDEESHGGLKTLVFNLFQIEAAPISTKGKVHICLADIGRLPRAAGSFDWPLDEKLLETVMKRRQGTYLSNWLKNNRLAALSNRYYLYKALQNEQVEISWICQQGEKRLSPSPYITLLHRLSDAGIQESQGRAPDLEQVWAVEPRPHLEPEFDMGKQREHSEDARLAYALCPMRFVYGYVLGEAPGYRNEYQQNRAIVRLIQVLHKLLGEKYTTEQISKQVFALFPGVRKAERRQIMDDVGQWFRPETEGGYTACGGCRFTRERFNLAFLDAESYYSAKKQAGLLMSPRGRRGISYENRGAEGSKNCEFCPHAGYCMKSLSGVDYRGEQQ